MYTSKIEKIENINWAVLNPLSIILASYFMAIEFAGTLRKTLEFYPDSESLKKMAAGELNTDNLQFGSYSKRGDHSRFLEHFLKEIGQLGIPRSISLPYCEYLTALVRFSDEERAMTIFSRESELSDIFRKILAAHNWDELGFGFYGHFLKKHIALDSAEGGHADLTKEFPLDPSVLDIFWTARLKFYTDALQINGPQT